MLAGIVQTFCFPLGEISLKQNLIQDEHIVQKPKTNIRVLITFNHFAMIPFIYKVGPY